MNIHILLMILFLKESDANWKLVWNDEFNNQILDTEKWEIENESNKCHGDYVEHNNCHTNSNTNLRLVNGTLAITAIYEKHLDKDFTSGKIISKQNFTYGRFEIRAALPEGKMLRSSFHMLPITYANSSIHGMINIMNYRKTSKIGSGLYYNNPSIYENHKNGGFLPNASLNDFHTYALEWNELEFKWFFDDYNYLTINISRSLGVIYARNGDPFHKPFRLVIFLGVGDRLFSNDELTFDDVINWKCSLLILDYIRIYQWNNSTEKLNSKDDRDFSDKICSSVMPLIRPKKNSISVPTINLVLVSIFIITLIILIIVFSFKRQKKLKQQSVENNLENYDDVHTDGYEGINDGEEYVEPYQELSEYNVENYRKTTSFDKHDQKEKRVSEGEYLKMDKKF